VNAGAPADGQFPQRIAQALTSLGSGLLCEQRNEVLLQSLTAPDGVERFWLALLGWVHQSVCLFKAEACDLLHSKDASLEQRLRFRTEGPHGWLARCASLAARDDTTVPTYEAWAEQQQLWQLLSEGNDLWGVPATGGLFRGEPGTPWADCVLADGTLARALTELGALGSTEVAAIDWQALRTDQLGAAYEQLLECVPHVDLGSLRFELRNPDDKAHTRRRRGSYYTPAHLIERVLCGALDPLLREAETGTSDPAARTEQLLTLRLLDPSCGSGYFLVAAARKLAAHVACARNEAGDDAGAERALADVIEHCIYGIDLDPLATELCIAALWFEAKTPGLCCDALRRQVRVGNALLGTSETADGGPPQVAWRATEADQRVISRALQARNKAEHARSATAHSSAALVGQRAADAWCAAFLWPKAQPSDIKYAPTHARFLAYAQGDNRTETARGIERLCKEHKVLHWPLAFAQVFERGGFDLVLGNPPWIAHAGRAAQPLAPRVKAFFQHQYEAFADYPTTHGMFISNAARALREGGALGLVIPSSVSELQGYEPTRRAHDRLCDIEAELQDFGEGQFEGVTQPCMALVSRRRLSGRKDEALGAPWPILRPDLDPSSRALLQRLGQLPQLPAQLFGERGVQSDKALRPHFAQANEPTERFTTAIREGSDVREFQLLAPRVFVDRQALGSRMRSSDEFESVRVVVRQTARYPIAALSDGKAFRNSLLAAFETQDWPAPALVALLNSSLIRWLHYVRFRDARQPILPQLKIAHLRSIPTPPLLELSDRLALADLGERLSSALSERDAAPDSPQRQVANAARAELDALVHRLYGVGPSQADGIDVWHARLQTPRSRRVSVPS
jgi:hypothetical protein